MKFLKSRSYLILLLVITQGSCYTYHVFPREDRSFVAPQASKTAYVINPELKKENKIIRLSDIFKFTEHPDDAEIQILLHPLDKQLACSDGIIGYAMLLGQIPIFMPDRYNYQFDEIAHRDTINRKLELHVAQRYWFWSFFVINKKFTQKAGQSLTSNYYRQQHFE